MADREAIVAWVVSPLKLRNNHPCNDDNIDNNDNNDNIDNDDSDDNVEKDDNNKDDNNGKDDDSLGLHFQRDLVPTFWPRISRKVSERLRRW